MRRTLRFMLPFAVLTFTVLIATTAMAAPATWQRVDVTLHAEGSGGTMLVSGELPPSVALPAGAELSVPAGSSIQWIGQILGGEPSADPTLQYVKSTTDGLDVYRFTLTKSRVAQIEVPTAGALAFDGVNYAAALKWVPSQDVPEVKMSLRLPQGAQIIRQMPDATVEPGEEGFSYYTKTIKNAKAGNALDLTFSYSTPAPTGVTGSPTSTTSTSSASIVLVVVVLAFAMAAVVIAMVVRQKPTADTPVKKAAAVPASSKTKSARSAAAANSKAPVLAPAKASGMSGASKRNILTLGAVGMLIIVTVVVGAQTTKPKLVGNTVTQTFSQGTPCANVIVPLNLTDDADRLAVSEKLFGAIRQLDGMNAATLNFQTSTIDVGFCESKSNENLVRQGLLPTGLVAEGTTSPAAPVIASTATTGTSDGQALTVDTSSGSFAPNQLTAKAGVPIEITFGQGAGCLSEVVFPDLKVRQSLEGGPVTIKLPALQPGAYAFACGMDMQRGLLVVQ